MSNWSGRESETSSPACQVPLIGISAAAMYAQLTMVRENLHMLQVMVTRAAKALSTQGFTSQSVQQSDSYYATYEKPSALLQAHQMLTREHRLTLSLYSKFIESWGMPKYARP